MEKTTAAKLQIKPGNTVYLAGGTTQEYGLIEPLPDGASVVAEPQEAEAAVLFAQDRAALDALLTEPLAGARAAWIAYPKGNRTDINRDSIWQRLQELRWTLNANVSVSETWSAVRLKSPA